MRKRLGEDRRPVKEDLPVDLPEGERRPARIRLVAGRRLAGLTVILDGVHDPHNISAVLRSCEGFGVQNVHIIGRAEELPSNRAITKGCEKWLTRHYHDTPTACANTLHAAGYQLWAAMPDRSAPVLEEVDFSQRIALVFGAERDGVSNELLAACDHYYQIPMPGFSQSLNVSVAAAISLYVAAQSRRRALNRATDMDPAEVEALTQAWLDLDAERRGK